jgi:hypothetical protein
VEEEVRALGRVPEVRELRQMREENARLKRLVVDLTLDKQILQEVIRKKSETSSQTGADPVGARPLSGEWSACALARICPNTWLYKTRARDAAALRMRIREIAQARPRFGYVRIWILLRREGWPDNKKRVHRLYRLEGLQLRMRARRKKRLSLHRGVVPPASGRDQAWSMDFVHDQLVTGRAFRVLTVIDQWSRESVLMEAKRVIDRPERRRCARGVVCTAPVAQSDHRGSRHRIHLQGAGRMGLLPRRRLRLHPARQARRERIYREF